MAPAVDVERVHEDAREITASYTRVDSAAMGGCLLVIGLGVIAAAFAAGETGDTWVQKILHGVGYWVATCIVAVGLYAAVDGWAKGRACQRFNRRFPFGEAERDEALYMLSQYSDENVSEHAFLEALGGGPDEDEIARRSRTTEASVEEALEKLEPPDAWPPSEMANEPAPPAAPPPKYGGGVIPLRPEAPEEEAD